MMNNIKGEQDLNLVIAGHVDHGKSTIIGRMLADTDSLPEGKLEQVKETCRKNSKPFEYAFLLQYIILDAPGHIEFLKNMVTGAARAEAALLVIDASEGVKENSRRHGYMLSMLGIKQIAVVVNKMDLVDYDQDTYQKIVEEYTEFLAEIGLEAETFIPVSGMLGDNVADKSENMDWYQGQTVLEQLDSFENEALPHNKPFRMPVQDVYKFTKGGDDRRIVAGTVGAGELNIGDEVVFYPSGKKSTVKSIEGFAEDKQHKVKVGKATGPGLMRRNLRFRHELRPIYSGWLVRI
jgi:bifunctional enzyme CysN/CysC